MNAKQARALTEKHAPAPDIREEIRRFEGYVRSAAEDGRCSIEVRWRPRNAMVRYVRSQGFHVTSTTSQTLIVTW